MNVVLVEPEIPWNTGNIGRTCLAVGADLHIVGKAGFSFKDKDLQRAGLDYWKHLKITFHEKLTNYLSAYKENPFYFFSAHGQRIFNEIKFSEEDSLIFGGESNGLGEEVVKKYYPHVYKIPVKPPIRSLNLSTAVGIVLYEAQRQIGYEKTNGSMVELNGIEPSTS